MPWFETFSAAQRERFIADDRRGLSPERSSVPALGSAGRPDTSGCPLSRSGPAKLAALRLADQRRPKPGRCIGLLGSHPRTSRLPSDCFPVGRVCPFTSTLATAVMVFQLRVVADTPKSRSISPR